MTTSYHTSVTVTDTDIIIDSSIGNERKITTIHRGPTENQLVGAAMILHKQRADVVLNLSTPNQIESRQSYDAKNLVIKSAVAP